MLSSARDGTMRSLSMVTPPSADLAQYRVTFFFGPEPVENQPDHVRCVFNVKKRSWKGGVQVGIDVAQDYLDQAREQIGFSSWLHHQLQQVSQEDRGEVMRRAEELFIQSLCTCALNLALQAGIEQQNQIVAVATFATELRRITHEQPEQVTDLIRLELDLGETSEI